MYKIFKVFLDPSCRVWYSTFYIHGLISTFGKQNLIFSNQYFLDLKRDDEAFLCCMAFVVVSPDDVPTKVIIDYQDRSRIMPLAYAWCDVYAKINLNDDLTDSRYYEKIVNIPPGFAIKLWNRREAAYYGLTNFLKCRSSKHIPWERFFRDYHVQTKRVRLEDYLSDDSGGSSSSDSKPFVFMIGRLWVHPHCIDHTNILRKKFIETCHKIGCDFEGGFLARKKHPQYEEFKHLCFLKPYSTQSYIKKTMKSAIVFNTPTVHNCHGWKLGEFLAMGKAIISTPLSNRLPEDLVHGENIHFISNEDEMESAIHLLLTDHDYRKKLEKGAKAFYDKYADPQQVINSIMKFRNTINEFPLLENDIYKSNGSSNTL